MKIIKKLSIFENVFCRSCGHLQWLKLYWKMTDAPSEITNTYMCCRCAPDRETVVKLFERMVKVHEEQRHISPRRKPVFKPYIVRK